MGNQGIKRNAPAERNSKFWNSRTDLEGISMLKFLYEEIDFYKKYSDYYGYNFSIFFFLTT
jgi:hypothetical protein